MDLFLRFSWKKKNIHAVAHDAKKPPKNQLAVQNFIMCPETLKLFFHLCHFIVFRSFFLVLLFIMSIDLGAKNCELIVSS